MKEITVYKDRAGNRLCKKYIKTRKVWQYYAKNREGKLLKPSGFNTLARKAGLPFRARRPGIERRRRR